MNKFEKVSLRQYIASREGYLTDPYDECFSIKLPKRATKNSAGYDFFSPFDFELAPGDTLKIPTGIRVQLDKDKFLAIYPRSSLGFKYRLQLDNVVGIIDSDYYYSDNEGHIFIKLTNDTKDNKTLYIKQGEAFAQGIIQKFYTTEDDSADGIRNGGMGSTNKI